MPTKRRNALMDALYDDDIHVDDRPLCLCHTAGGLDHVRTGQYVAAPHIPAASWRVRTKARGTRVDEISEGGPSRNGDQRPWGSTKARTNPQDQQFHRSANGRPMECVHQT